MENEDNRVGRDTETSRYGGIRGNGQHVPCAIGHSIRPDDDFVSAREFTHAEGPTTLFAQATAWLRPGGRCYLGSVCWLGWWRICATSRPRHCGGRSRS